MSLTEDVTTQASEPVAGTPVSPLPSVLPGDLSNDGLTGLAPPTGRVLLVWDAPNLDMGLGSILGRRPTALERPASTRWAAGCWPHRSRRRQGAGRAGHPSRTGGHRLHQYRARQRRCGPPVGGRTA
ncbi:hypothetical protein BZL30_6799 [Mycobacterium kansasii]|uniref:Uncharacterized protein n=1 Tax=Mycobacterium kansasii TaxID=1768 RepID=A0A1V3WPT8_MYCKA|nr:hypothetical protein BZL30_6799 [Mycobacterium kansasii]